MLTALNKDSFNTKVLNASGLVLVDFWSPTCGPCEMYNQVLEKLEPSLKDTVKFFKLNVDEEIELANQQFILIMPTTKIYLAGQCVKELLGVQTPNEIQAAIENLRVT